MPGSGLEVAAAAMALANSALDALFKISDRVATQLGAEGGLDLAFIRDEFAMMQAFLKAADDRSRSRSRGKGNGYNKNKVVSTWVRQVRVLAYDVEDCLEDSALRLARRRRRRSPSSWLLRLPRAVKARRRIADDIKMLRAKVEDVSNRNLRYRLINYDGGYHDELSSSRSAGAAILLAAADDDEAHHQRRQSSNARPEASLAHLIISSPGGGSGSELHLQVISVWGRDDHGRVSASVVREAYDDPETEKTFQWRAWVNVAAHPFSPHEFVKSLLTHFDGEGGGNSSIKAAAAMSNNAAAEEEEEDDDRFERLVKEKRYLFVLDDLADAEVWLWIKKRLPDEKNGSRIIVRAQHQGIAMLCPKQPIQVLGAKMSDDYESLYGHPPPPIYLIFTEGLEQGGSEQGARSNSIVAGESSGSTVEPKEDGQRNSDATGQQDDPRGGSLSAALEENVLVGRDSDASKLIDLILSAKRQGSSRIMCVFGAGGIGKTALVKSIWQSEKLHGTFERLAWVTMRDTLSHHEFTSTVKQQLDPKRKKTDTFRLPNRANKRTSAKGILLVLDDVSSKKDWDVIKSALPVLQDKVSQVIITTREPSIAKLCDKTYNLPPLQVGCSLELFKKKVKVDLDRENLSDVANEIVAKCGGIPQVVITVAVSLQERPIIKEWEKTRDHLNAELVNNPKLRDTNRILTSGYKNLPSNLKSCFLYLSVFPEDGIIRRRRLVKRWIAEGYSSEKHGTSAEEVADKQFQDLISRNMIQPSRTTTSKIGTSGETYCFEFQNLMHSISRRISAEENHVLVLDEDEHSFQSKNRTRHLTVMSGWSRNEKKSDALESVVDLSCLRSLTVFGKFKSFFISKKMRLLRVLDLEDTYGLRCGDLSSICKLYHLRYLSLRGSIGIFRLPDSFGNLPNLETLDVRDTSVTKLPSSIVKLKKLKYLRAGMIACDEDESCNRAPGDLWNLISEVCFSKEPISEGIEEWDLNMSVTLICLIANVWLRGFDPYGVKVPRGIGKLKFLQTLGVINVARGKKVLKEIKKLTRLHKLGVTGINRNNCKELVSAISNHRHLQSLSMRAEGKVGLHGCLDEMTSPPEDLQSLKLYGNLGKLPGWIRKLRSLVKLTLRSTLLKQDAIEILGKLENLATLRFQDKSFKDEEVNFPCDTFASLMVLEIGCFDSIRAVKFDGSAAQKLKLLLIKFDWFTDCPSDVRFTGVRLLSSLMEVQLHDLDYGPGPEEDFPESDPADDWLKKNKERWARNRAFKEHLVDEINGNPNRPGLEEY